VRIAGLVYRITIGSIQIFIVEGPDSTPLLYGTGLPQIGADRVPAPAEMTRSRAHS
jgi:hypothetical protein